MGKLFKNTKILNKKPQPLETYIERKLSLYITVTSQGQGNAIVKIFEKCGSSANFIQMGEGTAVKELQNILGIENNSRDIIFSFVPQDRSDEVRDYLSFYFSSRAKNAGISISVPLASIIGVKVYQFLADTIKEEKQ